MAIAYQIIERSITPTGGLYILARFWASQAAKDANAAPVTESFHLASVRRTRPFPETDGRGWYRLRAGGWLDPATIVSPSGDDDGTDMSKGRFVMTTVPFDIVAKVRQVLGRFARKLTDADFLTPTDRSDRRYPRSTRPADDTHNLLDGTTDLENDEGVVERGS